MQTGKQNRLRQILLKQLRLFKGSLAWAAICTVSVAAIELLKPWPLKIILDHAILGKPPPAILSFLPSLDGGSRATLVVEAAGAIVLLALVGGLLAYAQTFVTSALGFNLVYALRREMFTHLQRLSLSFHNRARTGDLLTRISSDTSTLKDVFTDTLLKLTAYLVTVIGMLVILLTVNWQVGLIAVATLPILGYSMFHRYHKTKASVKKQRKQEGQVVSRMGEVLSAIPLVQAFAREKYEEEQFDQVTNQNLQESIRLARLQAAANRSSEIITTVGTAVAVLFGAFQVMKGNMLPGDLVLVVAYLNNMYKPVRGLAKLSTDISKISASAERISEVLETEPQIQDRPDAIEADGIRGEIAFQNVSFDYGDGKHALKNISFAVSPGQRLALVGVSGAGKSTVASLTLRLYDPQQGSVSIDGVNLQHYRRESLRQQIGVVLQQSILFGATVKENIAYGKPEASLEEIVAAAQAANADEFIRELEEGYDTIIGERGSTLSGGQRQRIAIARTLIREAPILILDEPMTGLDVESESKVREALNRLMAGRTCLMITHDLPAIADADLVLVFEAGQIVERGTHDELVATSSRYRQLYEMGTMQTETTKTSANNKGVVTHEDANA
ncbi:MAG TPA: ABC transporter ATP-binding protein [Verrucomicrobiae bacterium]|jgi:ATP-binding cassette subfamily B protein/subfamily B ATP-binding cassette protein MsbA